MWKQLTLVVTLLSLLALPAATAAQDDTFRVWQVVTGEDASTIEELAAAFAEANGLDLELETIEAALLFDLALRASQAGVMPDVIFAGTGTIDPLWDSGMVEPAGQTGDFFLESLLEAYPDLVADQCGETPLNACLWEDVTPTLPLVEPQARAISLATSQLCAASPWLPFCSESTLIMQPLAWDFDLFLVDTEWLAANGIDEPVTVDDVIDLRGMYAIRFTVAREERIPTVDEANHPPVFVLSATLLPDHADAVMESLTSFYNAQYAPVISLNIYGAYPTADATHPERAREFIAELASDPEAKALIAAESGRLPALTPRQFSTFDPDDDLAIYTMRALALLTTYAALAY